MIYIFVYNLQINYNLYLSFKLSKLSSLGWSILYLRIITTATKHETATATFDLRLRLPTTTCD